MKLLVDGLSILVDNWQFVIAILFMMVASQFLIGSMIRKLFDDGLSPDEYCSLGMAGWLLPASLLSLLWYLSKVVQVPQSGFLFIFIIAIILFVCVAFLRQGIQTVHAPKPIVWALFGFLGISIILRLAFVSKTIIPMYFDSAQHYLYIKNFMADYGYPGADGAFKWLTANYYHFGFHILTAFTAATLHVDIKNAMLILGQMILAIMPISLFFIIKRETRSNHAGIFAVLLAGFGWYMPAYAVNWGKYPALASLPIIQFVLSMVYLTFHHQSAGPTRKRWVFNAILGLGILISIFFHSRSLLIFGIAILSWVLGMWWRKLPGIFQSVVVLVLVLGIIIEGLLTQGQDVLKPLLDPYLNNGSLTTSIILFLTFFAIKVYPNLAFSSIVSIFLFIGSLFIPVVGLIPGHGNLTLLDRPFVEMILYLPLSLLGGLGLAGLCEYLQDAQGRFGNIRFLLAKYAGTLFIGLILINTIVQYEFYPSDCCSIVGRDDLIVIDWMDKNLPPRAHILISTTELMVLPSNPFQGYVGGDAGTWIPPLINRRTFTLPYDSNFGQQDILDILCNRGIDYIYVGETGQTFNDSQIKANPSWYNALLSMSKAGVYQVIGCD
jgi:hypothetical protein